MNHETIVQFAVMCLQELDAHAGRALSFQEISQRQGIPLPDCARVLRQLSNAGIIELAEAGRVVLRRPVEDITALDILEAVWPRTEPQPAFQSLIGSRDASRMTLEFVQGSPFCGADSGFNG